MGTKDILDELNTQLAAALGVNVIKGFPDWARSTATPPLAALEITAWAPGANRIGGRLARRTATFRAWLFARHEPELCSLIDGLTTWGETAEATIDSKRVDLTLQDGLRTRRNNGAAGTARLRVHPACELVSRANASGGSVGNG
jgi:hypothetical protein